MALSLWLACLAAAIGSPVLGVENREMRPPRRQRRPLPAR
jgi:hypothetical protein